MSKAERGHATAAGLARLAARCLIDRREHTLAGARHRAAMESGIDPARVQLDNRDVQSALVEELNLFHHAEQAGRISNMREAAREVLEQFSEFDPCLSGAAWYGTALEGDACQVHLFSDEFEAVTRFLLASRLRYRLIDDEFHFTRNGPVTRMPGFLIEHRDVDVELIVFPCAGRLHKPLSTLDWRAMKRVRAPRLAAVIESGVLFPEHHG